jgi:hypothetical protein
VPALPYDEAWNLLQITRVQCFCLLREKHCGHIWLAAAREDQQKEQAVCSPRHIQTCPNMDIDIDRVQSAKLDIIFMLFFEVIRLETSGIKGGGMFALLSSCA